jgi:hypothetical protein
MHAMSTAFDGHDWMPVLKGLDVIRIKPDAYHAELRPGSTLYGLNWLDFSPPPANQDAATWWAAYDALCWLSVLPRDKYAIETLLLAHSRLIQDTVMEKLQRAGLLQRERFAITSAGHKPKQADLGGAEVFQKTLYAVWNELLCLPEFTVDASQYDGPDDGPEITDLLAVHIYEAAKKAAERYVKALLRRRKRFATLDGENMPESPHADTPQKLLEEDRLHAKAMQVVEGLAQEDNERQIIEMKELRLSDAEIGRRLGMKTHTVNRTWHRLLERLEEKLGLMPGKVIERAKRKAEEPPPVQSAKEALDSPDGDTFDRLLGLLREGTLTEVEMAARLGWTRDQVEERLHAMREPGGKLPGNPRR